MRGIMIEHGIENPLVLSIVDDRQYTVWPLIELVCRHIARKRRQRPVQKGAVHLSVGLFLVAYLRLADKYLGLLASRLRGVNQPVIRTRRGFQPLVTHRWPAFERKVSAPNLSPPT